MPSSRHLSLTEEPTHVAMRDGQALLLCKSGKMKSIAISVVHNGSARPGLTGFPVRPYGHAVDGWTSSLMATYPQLSRSKSLRGKNRW